MDELRFFWEYFHLIPSLYEDFMSVLVRSGLLLPKKRNRDFVPLLETRILLGSSEIWKKYSTCC